MSQFSVSIKSNIGGRQENQDCYAMKETAAGLLVVVCDGMGGMAGGRVAAEMACRMVTEKFATLDGNLPEGIASAIRTANHAIYTTGQSNHGLQNMGTTLAALLLEKKKASFFHAGDSRIYQLRNGQIEKRTADHSRVGEMVRRGILSDEQARLSENSNIISKALGIEPEIDVEVTLNVAWQKGDRFVVCTDGIWGAMSEERLVQAWSEDRQPDTIVKDLIEQIDAAQFAIGGGHDNMTLAIVEVGTGKGPGRKVSVPVLLNVLLGAALAASLIYIAARPGKINNNRKPAGKDSIQSTQPAVPVKDSGLHPPIDPNPVMKNYSVSPPQMNRIREMLKKLQAQAKADSTGKLKHNVDELSKLINSIK